MKLPLEFYRRENTIQIARELLGKALVAPAKKNRRVSGVIVETEAYLGPEDRAAHSYNHRRTARNEIMYADGGVAYVFFVYGMYHQFNVVTGPAEVPHAILVRAIEPQDGIDLMRSRRGKMADTNLTSGPGKLAIALGIDKSFNSEDLGGSKIWIERAPPLQDRDIVSGKRIGINYAAEYAQKPWRFWVRDNPFVSRQRKRRS